MPLTSGLKQFQDLGKIQNSSNQDEIRKLQGSILSGRVKTINQNGTGLDGAISVEILSNTSNTTSNSIPRVYPLFPNNQSYPLINETVVILPLISNNSSNNSIDTTYYYISTINLWNSVETNPLVLNNTSDFKPGTYFNEKGTINPLYSFEGDYIIEGRFGNSIRLGNTVPNNTAPLNNNWSKTGSLGDPITIISNGLHSISPSFNSITEDINSDKSSIYLTSTQQLPIEVSSQNDYLSYSSPPTSPQRICWKPSNTKLW